MSREFFDPPLEDLVIAPVSAVQLRAALRQVLACEACSEEADIPFDWVLDRVTGVDASVTDHLLEVPAACPWCGAPLTEKSLVEWAPDER